MNTIDKKASFLGECKSFLRENTIIIALVLLYILFYRFWETLIGEFFIKRFLCHFESNCVSDCIFIAGVLITCFLCYFHRKKRIDQKTILICLIAISFWIFYRFIHRICGIDGSTYNLKLTSLSFTSHIKYFDIVPIVAVGILASPILGKLIANLKQKNNNEVNEVDGFLRDYPIDGSQDILGRKELAHNVMARLLATDTTDGLFAVGIDAPWGSGKTSFMNMMKELVSPEDSNVTIIDFNPWLYSGDKITVFLGKLCRNLRKYDVSLAKNFLEYSRLISSFDTNDIPYIASLIDFVYNDKTLRKKKQQIRDAIVRIKKKIVVFVDDLDKLEAEEILKVMRLIRYISDFPNMYFVAAYDKNHLIQSLKTIIPIKGANFIDKVFQHEFRLPTSPYATTSSVLHNYLQPILTETDQLYLSKFLTQEEGKNHLPLITNLREAKRIANNFTSNYIFNKTNKAYSENQIISLYLLELFKIKYPLAFSFFESNWERMIIEKKSEDNQKSYIVLFDEPSNSLKINFFEHMQDRENRNNLNIATEDPLIIENILSLLFGKNGHVDSVDFLRHYFNPTI